LTAYSLGSRAGFVSHRRRSWDSPFGGFPFQEASPAFRLGRTHVPFALPLLPPLMRRPGPASRGFWARTSRKCLVTVRWFRPATTGASHGVCPSRATSESLDPGFSGSPLTRFAGSGDYSPNPPAPQSIDQPSPHSARIRTGVRPAGATLMGFLHLPDPDHSNPINVRAICFTSRRAAHHCRLTNAL
jgi:hypothetical protein